MTKKIGLPEAAVDQYDSIVEAIPEIERKGKSAPYTSFNGNMYSMMRKDGVLGIRLSKEDRDAFMAAYHAVAFENYGSMIKEYVEVPETVFMDKKLMVTFLKKSLEYTKTLKPKETKKTVKSQSKSSEKAPLKKVTHDVGNTYKNGQLKAEVKGSQLVIYYVDGSIKAQGAIVDEEMDGKWRFNRKGGQLWQVGHFIADVKNGEWITYDSKGEIVYHVNFKNGKVTEKYV